jgi:hypothetical protein
MGGNQMTNTYVIGILILCTFKHSNIIMRLVNNSVIVRRFFGDRTFRHVPLRDGIWWRLWGWNLKFIQMQDFWTLELKICSAVQIGTVRSQKILYWIIFDGILFGKSPTLCPQMSSPKFTFPSVPNFGGKNLGHRFFGTFNLKTALHF